MPRSRTCIEALDNGVEGVIILNDKAPHVVLVEMFTEHGQGTLIVRQSRAPDWTLAEGSVA